MMRRWHKLLAPWFALLLFAIALTGAVTQATALLDTSTAKATMPATGAKAPPPPAAGKRSAPGITGSRNCIQAKLSARPGSP